MSNLGIHDYRLNPFSGNLETVEMVDNSLVPENQPHFVWLRDVPEKDNPTSLSVRFFAFVIDESITAAATSINMDFSMATTFQSGAILAIDDEKMQIVSISGDVVNVTRGYDGTIPTIHTRPSATSPLIAYGPPLAEVATDPGKGQYQPDYTTKPSGDENWNTGQLRFNVADAKKWVEIKYKGIGSIASAERASNDPLRAYGYEPAQNIVAIMSGSVTVPPVVTCQVFYVRPGGTARASAPGLLVRASGAAVNRGLIYAAGLIGGGAAGIGSAAGGKSGDGNTSVAGYLYNYPISRASSSPSEDMQDAIVAAYATYPVFWGAPGNNAYDGYTGGAGGGGVALISPLVYSRGTINTSGAAGNGTVMGPGGSAGTYAGGGGGGGSVLIAGEVVINTGTYTTSGGAGAVTYTGNTTASKVWSSAGGAGWVKIIEFGGRN